jgi:hypothetical protein
VDSGDPVGTVTDRLDEYWSWVAVALFLLISVDGLTTLYAATAVGPEAESNPIVRWALGQGVPTLVTINIAATVLAVALFYALLELVRRSSGRSGAVTAVALEVFVGLLVAAGLLVFANNLSVIVLGRSLL